MKKSMILLLWIVSFQLKADVYQNVKIKLSYTHAAYMDKSVWLFFTYQNSTIFKHDSILLNQMGIDTILRNRWSDNFKLDILTIEIKRTNGRSLGKFTTGSSIFVHDCNGYINIRPFNGSTCASFTDSSVGTICANIFAYIKPGNQMEYIRNSGGLFSRPFEIYCTFDAKNADPPLKLSLPCGLNWQQKGSLVKWYESEDGKSNWRFLDTGLYFYPALKSYAGGVFYGVQRFYKAQVNEDISTGSKDAVSEVIGPVKFYLGWHLDSIKISGKNCSEMKNVTLYYKDDSMRKYNYQPRFWINYLHPDSSKEIRYQLQNVGWSPVKLADRYWLNQSVFPNQTMKLKLLKGRYRLMYDFTPWNGLNCKLFFDTFYLTDDFNDYFSLNLLQTTKLHCYGDSDASVYLFSSGTDTTQKYWSRDSLNWFKAPDTIKHLFAGNYKFYLKNQLNCSTYDTIIVNEPRVFYNMMSLDSTLCNHQNIFVNLHHQNAIYYRTIYPDKSENYNDTQTLNLKGTYKILLKDSNGCKHTDSIRIQRKDLDVIHDFLIPTKAFLSDTVCAVDVSVPFADKSLWNYSDKRIRSKIIKSTTNKMQYPDTGVYLITLKNYYSGCVFKISKNITIVADNDSNKITDSYGYKGPLIQKFEINPNPNDGINFTIKVQLRDTADIVIYKIDPISGDIIGDIDFKKKRLYEFTTFKSYGETIFFLKLVAGDERKTIKVVVIP